MKLSKLVCEVVFLALITSSEAAEPAKNETAASSQAAKPAAQTASVATPATTVNQAADQASHVASRPVSAASSYTGYSAYSQSALNSTKRLELDISKRTGTTDYSFVTSSLNNTSKFTAYYGTVFAKVKDGDFVLWDGKETESSLKVELTSDYRVTVTLQNGKVLMFQKGYKRWLEYDPKQVEVANYVDASGFSMGWEVHEAPAEAEKKEGEEGSKAEAVPTDHGDVDHTELGVAFSTENLKVTENVELDIKNRQQNNKYKYLKSPSTNDSKFVAYYGFAFTKVKDGNLELWNGANKEFSVNVELTSDYKVTVNLHNGKKKVFVKGYNRWLEHDPKEAEMQTAYDHSGFPVGWDLRGSLDEAEKKEGEDSKEGSKSGKSGRKVPGWGISLIAISATVLVVSIGVAVGVRMRK